MTKPKNKKKTSAKSTNIGKKTGTKKTAIKKTIASILSRLEAI